MARKKKDTPARELRKNKYIFTGEEKLIFYYRKHPVQACRDLLRYDGEPLELTWYQRLTLRAMWSRKFVFLLWGRAVAKTFMFAVFSILYAVFYPRTKIGLYGPTLRQANYIFEYIEEIIDESPYVRAGVKGEVSKRLNQGSDVYFVNGSKIEALPIGDGTKVRGKRYHVLIVDEYAQMDDVIVGRVLRPFLMIKKRKRENKLFVGTTAYWVWNHAWRYYLLFRRKEKDNDPDYFLSDYDYRDVVATPNCPFEYDLKMLEAQKEFMTDDEFGMEYLNKFPRDTSGYIPASLIDICTPKDEKKLIKIELSQPSDAHDSLYFIGLDPARAAGRDNFGMAILRYIISKRVAWFVKMFTLNGATYPTMRSAILDHLIMFPNVKRIHMDAAPAGGGLALKDLLADQTLGENAVLDIDDLQPEWIGKDLLRLRTPTLHTNNELASRFKAGLQQKKILFPPDVRRHYDKEMEKAYREIVFTKREIIGVRAEPTHSGRLLSFKVDRTMRKDRWSASLLAYDALFDYFLNPTPDRVTELPVGMWL